MSQSLATTPPVALTSFAALMAKEWRGGKPGSAVLKNVNMTAGVALTVFKYGGGPGVVSSTFMKLPFTGASTTSQNGYNGVFSVYIDGEATPSLTYDVGGPLMYWANGTLVAWTANMMSSLYSGGQGFTQRNSATHNSFFPIPWHSSILITFTPTTTITGSSSLGVNYVTGVYFPFKLCSSCMTYDSSVGVFGSSQYNRDFISGSGAVQFLNVQNQSGYIVYSWLCVSSAVNSEHSFCETNIGLYLDGNPAASSPSQTSHSLTTIGGKPDDYSSGTEDWHRTAFFGLTLGGPTSAPTNCRPGAGHPSSNALDHFTVDHLESDGGLRFKTSAVLQWETGYTTITINDNVANTAFTPFWGVFYYIDYTQN